MSDLILLSRSFDNLLTVTQNRIKYPKIFAWKRMEKEHLPNLFGGKTWKATFVGSCQGISLSPTGGYCLRPCQKQSHHLVGQFTSISSRVYSEYKSMFDEATGSLGPSLYLNQFISTKRESYHLFGPLIIYSVWILYHNTTSFNLQSCHLPLLLSVWVNYKPEVRLHTVLYVWGCPLSSESGKKVDTYHSTILKLYDTLDMAPSL